MTKEKISNMKKIWFITKENDIPTEIIDLKVKFKESKKFPNNFIFDFKDNILVFLNTIHDLTKVEFNHNLIWVGVKLNKYCLGNKCTFMNPEILECKDNLFIGWLLGNYDFMNFKSESKNNIKAKLTNSNKQAHIIADAITIVRNLINMPANHLGPRQITEEVKSIFKNSKVNINETNGNFLKKKFPLVFEVGKAAEKSKEPIFLELNWRSKKKKAKKVVLIGKGVCFDTGGLNLKLGFGMNLMKKDMGGAANCIGLAKIIDDNKLELDLKLLLPLVENSVSSKSMRPSDIIKSRKGVFIEIADTDAEGRLILADSLTYACETKPDLIVDMATLTGASRVALGTDVPSFFSNDEILTNKLLEFSKECGDPIWNLPLWQNYRAQLDSNHADIKNIGNSFGGAITAALFLEQFVTKNIPWIHIDLMAWNSNKNLSSYIGGEAMGIRCLYKLIEDFSKN